MTKINKNSGDRRSINGNSHKFLFHENTETSDLIKKLKIENVILTPHIAGWSNESKIKLAQITVDKIKEFLDL